MKKLFIILLSALSLTALAQQKKSVAVWEPNSPDNSVDDFTKLIIRGALESALSNSTEYEIYDRTAFEQILKEHHFQQSGAVSEVQIRSMGEKTGCDYVLVTDLSADYGFLSYVVKILNVETGAYDSSLDDLVSMESPQKMKEQFSKLANAFFGVNGIYIEVDEMPQFPGGDNAFRQYLAENIKYPKIAQENGVQGRAICQFIINTDGSVTDVEIIRTSGDENLDEEALRVVRSMPNWSPGKRNGVVVKVLYSMPIKFKLI